MRIIPAAFRSSNSVPAAPAEPGPVPAAGGFTLVELLVVVAIMATLMSLLLPSLSKARETARGVACRSNLRQVNTAAFMFANQHEGKLPAVGGNPPTNADGIPVRWFGGWTGGRAFVPEVSPLAPYWGDAQVGGCPTQFINDESRSWYGPVDYAYSSVLNRHWDWVDGLTGAGRMIDYGANLANISSPTQTVMMFDSARIKNGEPDRTPWGFPPSRGQANFHGRHLKKGNVGWADGHVSGFEPVHYPLHKPVAEVFNIGTIDEDGDPGTDELFDLE